MEDEDANQGEEVYKVSTSSLLLSIDAGAPFCLSQIILQAELHGLRVKSLLKTIASESFVCKSVVKTAQLKLQGKPSGVSTASNRLIALVLGKVCGNFLSKVV